jgi:predicted DNA-binding transcriptional regulator YafY
VVFLEKKILILNILDILRKYSDEDHKLSQTEILSRLEKEYAMPVERKAIKSNLMDLVDFENNKFAINYTETPRKGTEGIWSKVWLAHEFDASELRLLIDGLLFSKHLHHNHCETLIEKLKGLSSTYFNAHVKHIRNLPQSLPRNPELLHTVDILDEAISKERQVSFNYTVYGLDKKKHLRTGRDGQAIEYIINPYQMVATNGYYYLICNTDRYDNLANYRVDRISNIRLLDKPVKSQKKVKGAETGLDLPKHMAEHIYMSPGESVRVVFRAQREIVSDIVDWFGLEVEFSGATESEVNVSVRVNENAMLHWALQYGEHVEILEPAGLRDRVRDAVAKMAAKYKIHDR